MAQLETGDLVDSRFEVEFCAGVGGMGRVYRCRDVMQGGSVALKVMGAAGNLGRERFAREVRLLSELRHPGIVRYVGHGLLRDEDPYLVMEWIEGEALGGRVCAEPLSIRQAVSLVRRLCDALGEAHVRGIVHRDIKPANIILERGKLDAPKVLDFGLARAIDATHAITGTGAMLGTPAYMAPEQAKRSHDLDARVDVFALGCVLFECLAGYAAFRGPNVVSVLCKVLLEEPPWLGDLRTDMPQGLARLVASMLAKEPAARPADALAVREALAEIDLEQRDKSGPRPAIGGDEQRYLSVILAGRPFDGVGPELPTALGTPRLLLGMRKAVELYDAELHHLVDNTVMLTLRGKGNAADRATRGARCALAVRDLLPHVPVVLATGRGLMKARELVGDVIDEAVRLLQTASKRAPSVDDGGAVLVDTVSASLLDVRFDLRKHDDQHTALLSYRSHSVEPRKLLGRETPCVGRTRELAMLRAVWEECCEEPVARPVVVTGPPGIGKTRLIREWVAEIKQDDPSARILTVRADPMGAGGAFGMLSRLVRSAALVRDDDDASVVRQKVQSCVGAHVPASEVSRVAHFLCDMVGAPDLEAEDLALRAARHDPVLRGDQIRLALQDWLAAETRVRPLLIVLEDLHWGDATTVELVASVLRNLRELPLCVVGLARPELEQRFPRLWADRDVTTFMLGPLRLRAAVQLVAAALSGISDARAESIAKRSGGNPFFLEELVRAEAEGRSERAPDTVLAMLQARLDEFASSLRLSLRAASIFGDSFPLEGVAALLGDDADDLPRNLETLVAREVLVPLTPEDASARGDDFSFAQGLWREAAYATLTPTDCRLGHTLAADWLEARRPNDALAIAEHHESGTHPARAGSWFALSARQALGAGDYAAALERAERGVRCRVEANLGELYSVQAEAHKWRGENTLAETRASQAMQRLADGTRGWYAAAGEAAAALGKLGHAARLTELAQQLARTPAVSDAHEMRVIALARTVTQLVLVGRLDAADKLLAQLTRSEPDPAVAGWVYEARAVRAGSGSDPGGRVALAQLAAGAFTRAGDLRNACLQLTSVGFALNEVGSYVGAERALTEAIAMAERLDLANAAATARAQLGRALACSSNLEPAESTLRSAIAALRAQGNPRLEGVAHGYLAALLLAKTDLEAAEREARHAVAILAKVPALGAGVSARLAEVLLAQGRCEEAGRIASHAGQILDQAGALPTAEGLVRLVRAEALMALGRHAEAQQLAEAAAQALEQRSTQIQDPALRDAFEQVEEHTRTRNLLRQLTQDDSSRDVGSA